MSRREVKTSETSGKAEVLSKAIRVIYHDFVTQYFVVHTHCFDWNLLNMFTEKLLYEKMLFSEQRASE